MTNFSKHIFHIFCVKSDRFDLRWDSRLSGVWNCWFYCSVPVVIFTCKLSISFTRYCTFGLSVYHPCQSYISSSVAVRYENWNCSRQVAFFLPYDDTFHVSIFKTYFSKLEDGFFFPATTMSLLQQWEYTRSLFVTEIVCWDSGQVKEFYTTRCFGILK